MTSSDSPLLRLSAVHLSYRGDPHPVHALNGVSLSVRAGELLVIVGPSGSGKTSLLGVLCGWEEPDSGVLAWAGPDRPEGSSPSIPWSVVAPVPQTLGLLPELTLEENVGLPLRLAGWASGAEPARFMDRLGIGDLRRRFPCEASLGQQQRAAVARALVAHPVLIAADEPSAHLDAASSHLVYDALREATAAGAACVVATHDPVGLHAADRVVTMLDGTITG